MPINDIFLFSDMIPQILSHAFAAVALLALIISIDLLFNFKRPLILKLLLISISFCIFTLNLSLLLNLHYFITEISRILLLISGFNLISILYAHKIKREVVYLSLILFFLFIILLNGDNYETIHHVEAMRWPMRILRIIMLVISMYLFTKQHIQLFKSLNDKNIYSAKIKKWTSLTILIIVAGILNNIASIFLTGQHYVIRSNSLIIHMSICIFLLYRPAFLNRTELSIMLGKSFRKRIEDAVTADNFIFEFYTSSYFVNNDASLDELAKKLQVGKDALSEYIYETTKMNFSDLVNKSRIDYFTTLIESNKYNDYTIDALSELSGFGTRQSLYRNFKKFHGGNPSDLIRAKS